MLDESGEGRWFAVQVQTRYEKSADAILRCKGYETFLPLYRSRRYWSDRISEIDLPLFPGYLFCRFESRNWLPVLQTHGVLRVVGVGRTPVPVDDSELSAVCAVVQSGVAAEPWPFLETGRGVRIAHGPLAGLEGIVVESKSRYRLVVSVTILRRAVAAEIDSACVEPIHNSLQCQAGMQWMARPLPNPGPASRS